MVRLPALFGPGLRKNFLFDLMNPVPTMLPEARLETLLGRLEPSLKSALDRLYAPLPETGMWLLDRKALDADPKRAALDEAVCDAGMSAREFHNPGTTYQYYDMAAVEGHRHRTEAGLRHLHLTVGAAARGRHLYPPYGRTRCRKPSLDCIARTCAPATPRSGAARALTLRTPPRCWHKLAAFFARQRPVGMILSVSNIAWVPEERLGPTT